jgi:hypothetical protein
MAASTTSAPEASRPGATYMLVDVSGSTGGQAGYWREVAAVMGAARQGTAQVIVVPWDTSAFEPMSPDAFAKEFIARCRGEGGTASAAPAAYLSALVGHGGAEVPATPTLARLILITDGECHDNEAADAILGGRVFPFAECYIIEARAGSANMSVTAPFTRGAHIVTHIDNTPGRGGARTIVSQASDEDFTAFAQLESISTLDQFDAQVRPRSNFYSSGVVVLSMTLCRFPVVLQEEQLTRAVQAICLGTAGDALLRQRLLNMQHRVTRDVSERGGEAAGIAAAFMAAYDGGGDRHAKRAAIRAALPVRGRGLGARMSWLLAMTAGAVRKTFRADEIKLQRAAHAGVAAPVDLQDVAEMAPAAGAEESASPATAPWVCPVSLEEDGTPLVLLHEPPDGISCVLAGFDAGTTQWVCTQPLGIAGSALDAFLARFGHPVALATWKAASAAGTPLTQDPLTRRPVHTHIALPLGANAEHAAAADAALLHVFSDGRKVVSPDWLFAVWALAVMRGAPGAAFLGDIAEHARAQLMWRLRNRKTYAGLSGLSDMATVRLPL